MLAKTIITIIGTSLLALTIYGAFGITKNIWLITTSDLIEARVMSCKHQYFEGSVSSKALSKSRNALYTPVIRTAKNIKITGSVYMNKKLCKKMIGDNVKVIINNQHNNTGDIITFTQFWLPSVALFFGTLIANLIFIIPIGKAIISK